MKKQISIVGSRMGFRKISFNWLLRRHCGFSLSEAKHAVDSILEGNVLLIEIDDENKEEFLADAEKLGAICVNGIAVLSTRPNNLRSWFSERGQVDNVVVNLTDSSVSLADLTYQLTTYPIPGLKKVIIIIDKFGNSTLLNFDGK